ncbi:response regulator [Thermodesulfobacteriota bacterium]
MRKKFTILITDRNRYIREFLRREMMAEGYHIELAKNCKEVLQRIYNDDQPELLIFDLDMPDGDGLELLKKLQLSVPTMPVIVHSFLSEFAIPSGLPGLIAFVEKGGNSINSLKKVVLDVLQKTYPRPLEATLQV